METTLRSAAAVIMNTRGAAQAVSDRMPTLETERIHVIPNGYDSADFAGPPPEGDATFRIVFCGYAHTHFGRRYRRSQRIRRLLGGAAKGLDPLTRSHIFLLHALDDLLARRPDLKSVVAVHLAGVGTAGETGSKAHLKLHGYLPHPAAVRLMRSADLLSSRCTTWRPEYEGSLCRVSATSTWRVDVPSWPRSRRGTLATSSQRRRR